jgi:F0F1-type ATP synthase membrane subunit c/vacuolar-type H+-ATPase subunit K
VRRLLVRLIVLAALLASAIAAGMAVAAGVSWPIAVFRAVLAFLIVALAGAGVGIIVMRTALRRYYEQRQAR